MYSDYLRIIFSSITVYLFIIIAIRLFGKKELAQLSVIDLVFILLISNSVQNAMVGADSSLMGGLIAAGSLFIVNHLFKLLMYKFPRFNQLVEGESILLVYKGELNQKNLDKSKISMNELDEAIREHGVPAIGDVDLAVLEVDGNISVISDNFSHQTVKKRKLHKAIRKSQ